MSIQLTQRNFESIQQEYDAIFKTEPIRDEIRGYQWHARTLFRHHPKAEDILDLACGGGYFLKELQTFFKEGRLTGIDISNEALKIAKQICPEAVYKQGVAESLPFPNESFDAVACLGSLEHFLDIPKALSEILRVLRKDGVVYILVPNMFWYKDVFSVAFTGHRKDRNQTQERFASRGEWTSELEACGCQVTAKKKYNGIARSPFKQFLKDCLIPLNFSYHFVFICGKKSNG